MKLTKFAQRIVAGEDPAEDQELSDFVDSISTGDGFWYGLTQGGYIKPELIVEGKDLEKLKAAIKLVQEFEEVWDEISWEM